MLLSRYEVSRRVTSDFLKKFEALLPSAPDAACQRATMGLVHDHELRTFENEVFSPPRSLLMKSVETIVKRCRSNTDTPTGQIAFEPLDGATQNQLGVDVELLRQLALPLLGEMRWAEHGDSSDLAAVQKLASNHAASIVLPMPTSSAMSSRIGSSLSAIISGTS